MPTEGAIPVLAHRLLRQAFFFFASSREGDAKGTDGSVTSVESQEQNKTSPTCACALEWDLCLFRYEFDHSAVRFHTP